jgi:hypothetical protein
MKASWIAGVVLGSLALGCHAQDRSVVAGASEATGTGPGAATLDDDEDDGTEDDTDDEEAVALDQVPDAIRKAALAAVPGLVLTGAEKETEEGTLVYCLEGTDGGEAVEVEVRASDARVLEIERGEDDD